MGNNTNQRKKTVKKTTNKKKKFNLFKFIRGIIIISIILYLIYFCLSLIFNSAKPKVPTSTPAPVVKQATVTPQSEIDDYKQKQLTLINNLFRFNENLYLSMSNNSVVNIYPDSQNAVLALRQNFDSFSSKLDASSQASEEDFLNNLSILNNNYVQAVITYNTEALSSDCNSDKLSKLLKTLQSTYHTVNKYMNDNINLFKPNGGTVVTPVPATNTNTATPAQNAASTTNTSTNTAATPTQATATGTATTNNNTYVAVPTPAATSGNSI